MEKKSSDQIKMNRYPSIRSFEKKEAELFIGREQEKQLLYNKILSDRLVLVFARSGIGKSSLLNAGLIPLLEKRGFLPIPVRLSPESDTSLDSPLKILRNKLSKYLDKSMLSKKSRITRPGDFKHKVLLWDFIRSCSFPLAATPVLIFDQFEQFFDFDQSVQDQFLIELNELVEENVPPRIADWYSEIVDIEYKKKYSHWLEQPQVKVVIAIRSDRVYEMNRLTNSIPTIIRNRFELYPLNKENAEMAIQFPAAIQTEEDYASNYFVYQDELLRKMIGKLQGNNEIIETTQLQILCSEIETRIINPEKGTKKPPGYIVTEKDITEIGGMDAIINRFYENQVLKIGDKAMVELARRLIEDKLYDADSNSRKILFDEDALKIIDREKKELKINNLDNKKFLEKLMDLRLLREDLREKRKFYEISHDYLLTAIGLSYQAREAIRLAQRYQELENKNIELRSLKEKAEEAQLLAIEKQQEAEKQKQITQKAKEKAESLLDENIILLRKNRRNKNWIIFGSFIGVVALLFFWNRQANETAKKKELLIQNNMFIAKDAYEKDEYAKAFTYWYRADSMGNKEAGQFLDSFLFPVISGEHLLLSHNKTRCISIDKNETAVIWDIQKMRPQPTATFTVTSNEIAFSPNDRFVAYYNNVDSNLNFWDQVNKKLIRTNFKHALLSNSHLEYTLKYSPDNKYCMVFNREGNPNIVFLNEGTTGPYNSIVKTPVVRAKTRLNSNAGIISNGEFSNEGKFVALHSEDFRLVVYEVGKTGQPIQFEDILSFAFHPESPLITTFSQKGRLKLVNYRSKEVLLDTLLNYNISSYVFLYSPEKTGRLFIMDNDGWPFYLDYNKRVVLPIPNYYNRDLTNTSWSANLNLVAFFFEEKKKCIVYNMRTFDSLQLEIKNIDDILFSSDERTIYHNDPNGGLHIINAQNLKQTAMYSNIIADQLFAWEAGQKIFFSQSRPDTFKEFDLSTGEITKRAGTKFYIKDLAGDLLLIEPEMFKKVERNPFLISATSIHLKGKQKIEYLRSIYKTGK